MLDAHTATAHKRSRWYDAHVAEIELAAVGSGEQDKLKVHYRGWTTMWDRWFPRDAEQIQPLFSQTENWRDLKVTRRISTEDLERSRRGGVAWHTEEHDRLGTASW